MPKQLGNVRSRCTSAEGSLRHWVARYRRQTEEGPEKRRKTGRGKWKAVLVRQNLHSLKIDGRFLWDKSEWRVSPIFTTSIDKIKRLPIIFAQFRFITFVISALNVQMLRGEVTPTTRSRRAHRGISLLLARFLSSCDRNQNYPHWERCATSYCLYSKINVSDFFHTQ
jgi:hypothetical protein